MWPDDEAARKLFGASLDARDEMDLRRGQQWNVLLALQNRRPELLEKPTPRG